MSAAPGAGGRAMNIAREKLRRALPQDGADAAVSRRPPARLFTEGKVHGTAHFCIGEEATGVGVCSALAPEDLIAQTHRGHNQAIGKGMDVSRMMAEFLGQGHGRTARAGAAACTSPTSRSGILGANGIVGGRHPRSRRAPRSRPTLRETDAGRGVLLRRRRRQRGACPRGAEPGRDLEAARPLRLREQPVRHVDPRSSQRMRIAGHRRQRAAGYGMPG
ncbi:MAG: thiamine pyrophosphate-dependent enzyme [Candidatus Moduliflexus flocculans]|nr:thiamine pyrophosphate-dependent enzyme [Candidatus Moduliflexus flocculans]